MASLDLRGVAISTINAFVEWIDLKYLTVENGHLIVLLYSLFSSAELRIQVCECLIEIVSRKGSIGTTACYRRLFLELLSAQSLQGIQNVIKCV